MRGCASLPSLGSRTGPWVGLSQCLVLGYRCYLSDSWHFQGSLCPWLPLSLGDRQDILVSQSQWKDSRPWLVKSGTLAGPSLPVAYARLQASLALVWEAM